jgi:signal transduction histidine kinase
MLAVADETYIQVRNTLETLRAKEQRSMEETIRQHANQAGDRAAFSVQVHSSGPVGTLSPRQSREIASIACEALNNAEKHAGAEIVEVLLQWQDSEFRLTVRDDGRGFDSTEQAHTSGYGLVIMQERSRAINANLKIRSTPGNGTEVVLSLPLPGASIMVS